MTTATQAKKQPRKPKKSDQPPAKPLQRIVISEEAHCAAEAFTCKQGNRKKWIEEHDLFIGDDNRVYALVDTPLHVYFMDAITGSLIDVAGQHRTNAEKRVTGFRRAQMEAGLRLMNAFRDDFEDEAKAA